jgi:hypothetical protein
VETLGTHKDGNTEHNVTSTGSPTATPGNESLTKQPHCTIEGVQTKAASPAAPSSPVVLPASSTTISHLFDTFRRTATHFPRIDHYDHRQLLQRHKQLFSGISSFTLNHCTVRCTFGRIWYKWGILQVYLCAQSHSTTATCWCMARTGTNKDSKKEGQHSSQVCWPNHRLALLTEARAVNAVSPATTDSSGLTLSQGASG